MAYIIDQMCNLNYLPISLEEEMLQSHICCVCLRVLHSQRLSIGSCDWLLEPAMQQCLQTMLQTKFKGVTLSCAGWAKCVVMV